MNDSFTSSDQPNPTPVTQFQPSNEIHQPINELPPTDHNKSQNSMYLLIALLLIAVGVAGYFGYQNYQLTHSKTQQALPTSTLPPTATSPATSDQVIIEKEEATTDWETYSNQYYSVEYPQEWQLDDSSPQSLFLTINGIEILNPGTENQKPASNEPLDPENYARIMFSEIGEINTTLEDVASEYRHGEKSIKTIDGNEAISVVQPPNSEGQQMVKGGSTVSVFVKNNQGVTFLLQLETANIDKFLPIFEKMLTTFEFKK